MTEKTIVIVNERGEVYRKDGEPLTMRDVLSMWEEWDEEDREAEPLWKEFFEERWEEVKAGKANQAWIDFFKNAGYSTQNPPPF